MTLLIVVIAVLVFVAAASVIAWPVLRGDTAPEPEESAAGQERKRVEDDLQRTLESIKEIEFDHASGHLSDEDFSTLDADERAKAIELLRERDAIVDPSTDAPGTDA
jgi:hypothetical protein